MAGATVIAIVIATGVAAIVLPYIEAGVKPSIPNSVVGWTLIGSGWILADRGSSPAAWLIVASGAAWFAGDLSPLLSGVPREALEASALGYLALLAHGVLTAPSGRVKGLLGNLTVAVMYVVAIAAGAGYYRRGLVVAGAAIVVAATHRWVTSRGRGTRSARAALGAGLVLGAGICVTALLRLTTPGLSEQVVSRVLLLSIVVAAVLLACAGSTRLVDESRLDLGIGSVSAFEKAVGAALGRDAITVRFPTANGRWVDPAGDFAGIAADRMDIIYDGYESNEVLAALGGSSNVAADLPAGMLDLLRLARERARLNVEVRSRLDELADSRRRLLAAGDAERRQLEQQMRTGALSHIATVEALINGAKGLQPLRERVDATQAELDGVALGIDPLADSCLRSALDQIAKRSAVDVTVDAPVIELPAHIARAVWYTCSEAVANAAKHAPESSVTITLCERGDAIVLEIEDDGPGGADPNGWGLRGLADRAAALGGSFGVNTCHAGTRIALEIPLPGEG